MGKGLSVAMFEFEELPGCCDAGGGYSIDPGVAQVAQQIPGVGEGRLTEPFGGGQNAESCLSDPRLPLLQGWIEEPRSYELVQFGEVLFAENADSQNSSFLQCLVGLSDEVCGSIEPLQCGGACEQVERGGEGKGFCIADEVVGVPQSFRYPVEGCGNKIVEPPLGLRIALGEESREKACPDAYFHGLGNAKTRRVSLESGR